MISFLLVHKPWIHEICVLNVVSIIWIKRSDLLKTLRGYHRKIDFITFWQPFQPLDIPDSKQQQQQQQQRQQQPQQKQQNQ